MWQVLSEDASSWTTIFGKHGERGEYMDGYSKESMLERCLEDYRWNDNRADMSLVQRADMMSHLYDNEKLWKYVSMVAFAEHYVLDETRKPFNTFKRQKESQSEPIFCGVVFQGWEKSSSKLAVLQEQGIDYIRLECNLGDITPKQLIDGDPRLKRLAEVAKVCQEHEMVPVLLLQVPWRETGCIACFQQVIKGLSSAFMEAKVESKLVMLETRPPVGISTQEERELGKTARQSLGLEIGKIMFGAIEEAFHDGTIAGFCVAGGSTKGKMPTAMEDDTQDAVRQGMRQSARRGWGYDVCFWEMGAKLMLQPEVGQLWGEGKRDAASDLFCTNAQNLANEIKVRVPE